MQDRSIHITGKRTRGGIEVVRLRETYYVGFVTGQYLLELAWARASTETGVLFNCYSFIADGDHLKACQLVKRLREALGAKEVIESCLRGYRIDEDFSPPILSKSILDWPDLDYRVYRRMEEILLDPDGDTIAKPFPRTA